MSDPALSGSLPPDPVLGGTVADPPLSGTVVTAQPIDVELGAGQGMAGRPGVGSIGEVVTVEYAIVADGPQTLALPRPVTTPYSALFINGLHQSPAAYSLSGATLSLPADLLLLSGDTVSLDFA